MGLSRCWDDPNSQFVVEFGSGENLLSLNKQLPYREHCKFFLASLMEGRNGPLLGEPETRRDRVEVPCRTVLVTFILRGDLGSGAGAISSGSFDLDPENHPSY